MKQRFQLPSSLSCGRGPWAIPGGRLVVLPRGQSRCPDFKWSTEHKHNWPHGTPTHRESAVKQTLSFCKFISLRHQGFGGQTGEVSLFHPFSSSGLQQQNFGPWWIWEESWTATAAGIIPHWARIWELLMWDWVLLSCVPISTSHRARNLVGTC